MALIFSPWQLLRLACDKAGGKLQATILAVAAVTPLVVGRLALQSGLPLARWIIPLFVPPLMAMRGYRSKSLSPSGAFAAIAVGFALAAAHLCFTGALLAFFLSASRVTKWGQKAKRRLEADFKEGWSFSFYVVIYITARGFRVLKPRHNPMRTLFL